MAMNEGKTDWSRCLSILCTLSKLNPAPSHFGMAFDGSTSMFFAGPETK